MSLLDIFKSEPCPDVILHDDKIVFNDGNKDVVKISKEGFFFNGEKVDDKGQAYDAFNDWLSKANAW